MRWGSFALITESTAFEAEDVLSRAVLPASNDLAANLGPADRRFSDTPPTYELPDPCETGFTFCALGRSWRPDTSAPCWPTACCAAEPVLSWSIASWLITLLTSIDIHYLLSE